jgi:hypothetical protein
MTSKQASEIRKLLGRLNDITLEVFSQSGLAPVKRGKVKEATTHTKVAKAPKEKVKAAKPKVVRDMQCRHEDDGERCQERSKGPRFHFLCAEHLMQTE